MTAEAHDNARQPWWRRPARLARDIVAGWVRRHDDAEPRLTYTSIAELRAERRLAPPLMQAPHVLRDYVDELALSGALDEGSAHVFDPTIRSWVEQWTGQTEDEYNDRLVELRLREAEAEADADRRQYLLAQAERGLEEAENTIRRLRGDLPPAPPAPRQSRSENP